MILFQQLYEFFLSIFGGRSFGGLAYSLNVRLISDSSPNNVVDLLNQKFFQLGDSGYWFSLPSYLALLCSIIATIFIVVLCCLFIYKIIKLVGGLIR